MKKLIVSTVIGAVLCLTAKAQPTNSQNPIVELGKGLAALGSSTNWGFVGYGTLGDKVVNKQRAYGGGLIGIYSLNQFMGLGGGIDYLTGFTGTNQVTILNLNIQVQLPLKPFSLFSTNSWATGFTVTPFLYSALGTPVTSTLNQNAITHEGEGVNVDLFAFSGWEFGLGFAYIERQNAGVYSGNYKNFFAAIHHSF